MLSTILKTGKFNIFYFSYYWGFYFFSTSNFAYKKIEVNLPIRRWQSKVSGIVA